MIVRTPVDNVLSGLRWMYSKALTNRPRPSQGFEGGKSTVVGENFVEALHIVGLAWAKCLVLEGVHQRPGRISSL